MPDPITQSAVNLIADTGVVSLIQDWHHTLVEIDCKISNGYRIYLLPDPLVQSAVNLIADTGVVSLIQDWHHTLVKIDCKISSRVILLLLLIQERLL